jgi:hypothetical protein
VYSSTTLCGDEIKVPFEKKGKRYVAPMASFKNALNGPNLPP